MINRILAILLVLLISFSFAACSSTKEKADSQGDQQINSYGNDNYENEEKIESDETDEVELPKGFRADLVPIFKGSVVIDAVEDAGMAEYISYSVACYSDKKYEAVAAFYKEIMSNYKIQQEQIEDGFYYVSGDIDDMNRIEILVSDLSTEDRSELPKDAKTFFQLMLIQHKKGEIPEGYRADLVPVMEGSKLRQDRVYENKDGKKVFSLTFDTEKELQEVIEFYREIMIDAEAMQESEHPNGCNIEGSIDNVKITISISSFPAGEFKTAYTVEMVM